MPLVRRALGPVAALWLCCHIGLLASAPIVFWTGAAEELLECTCSHGDHAICPMHHKPAPGSKICLMRSANDNDAAVLSSFFSFIGVLTAPTLAITPPSPQSVVATLTTTTSNRPAPPDPPPPRA
jgi:hypothetical protein